MYSLYETLRMVRFFLTYCSYDKSGTGHCNFPSAAVEPQPPLGEDAGSR